MPGAKNTSQHIFALSEWQQLRECAGQTRRVTPRCQANHLGNTVEKTDWVMPSVLPRSQTLQNHFDNQMQLMERAPVGTT